MGGRFLICVSLGERVVVSVFFSSIGVVDMLRRGGDWMFADCVMM